MRSVREFTAFASKHADKYPVAIEAASKSLSTSNNAENATKGFVENISNSSFHSNSSALVIPIVKLQRSALNKKSEWPTAIRYRTQTQTP